MEIPGERIAARTRSVRDRSRYEGKTRGRTRENSMAERRFQSSKPNRYKAVRICNAACFDMRKCGGNVEKAA